MIAWLKANPDKATAGTAGVGSTSHINAVRFQALTGTRFRFVPYRGLGPAMRDLMAGKHIDILFDLAANSMPQIQAQSIKPLAVTAHSRLPSARRFRPWTKPACRASTSSIGTPSGLLAVRPSR